MQRRLILCPHGLPRRDEARAHFFELLQSAAGDVERVIDAPSDSLERFAEHLVRLHVLQERRERALVALTRTNPLALTVLQARRTLEEAIPRLATVPWLIYVDLVADPFFFETAERLGTLDAPIDRAPVWTTAGERFFILSSQLDPSTNLADRLFDLERIGLSRFDAPESDRPGHQKRLAGSRPTPAPRSNRRALQQQTGSRLATAARPPRSGPVARENLGDRDETTADTPRDVTKKER